MQGTAKLAVSRQDGAQAEARAADARDGARAVLRRRAQDGHAQAGQVGLRKKLRQVAQVRQGRRPVKLKLSVTMADMGKPAKTTTDTITLRKK